MSRSAADDRYWAKWSSFCRDTNLAPLLALYRDPVPILKAFARQYQIGDINPSGHQIRSHMVEDAVRLIGKALATLGTRDPHLTIQGEL